MCWPAYSIDLWRAADDSRLIGNTCSAEGAAGYGASAAPPGPVMIVKPDCQNALWRTGKNRPEIAALPAVNIFRASRICLIRVIFR